MRLHIIKRGVEFLGETFAGDDTVSMGESKNEEVTDLNVRGDFVERSGRMPNRRLVAQAGLPIAMSADGDVFHPLHDR